MPNQIEIASGNNQFGAPGEKLQAPLTARVTSNWGFGVPLVPVWFKVEGNKS